MFSEVDEIPSEYFWCVNMVFIEKLGSIQISYKGVFACYNWQIVLFWFTQWQTYYFFVWETFDFVTV